jgi:hypothetical protein
VSNQNNITVKQTQGVASKGRQNINIDCSIHNYTKSFKNLTKTHNGAIIFDSNILRDVILEISDISDCLEQKPKDFIAISIEEKNKLNGMSQEFYDDFIARDYEPYFVELDIFLKLRESEHLQDCVGKIVKSLNKKIHIGRSKFESFESLLLQIEEALLDDKYSSLNGKEESISLFLFYLYAECYIGKKV